ncbi:DUF1211 domain-containing protein [Pedobacter sp. HMF7647]|uniref:DUF1211 domain-containing protein n=1 Tax=Hufsiella arboris TaxID=2695275 RepID=A0A7K1YD94_9SPHI|nr:TMEM175 family protein [Hufsiella arboris]MXV52563.1 DUF1211 domain-containing protein [Hufsiella arboris]
MHKGRLEAFSDGVFAIIITIMVLEIKTPHGTSISDLKPVLPVLLSYLLSFVYVGIYWNNHHHMLYTTKKVNGSVLWANLHLLFWLSLIPFVTAWMDENHFASAPVALYGFVLFMNAMAWLILQKRLICVEGNTSLLALAIGKSVKEKISPILYFIGIAVAFFNPWISILLYIVVALIWLIPDLRIEHSLNKDSQQAN